MTTHETDPTGQEAPGEPMGFEFDAKAAIEEIYRAVERRSLSPEDALRIITKIDKASTSAEVADEVLTEYYDGPTAPI